jgi:hypothetical protein
LRSLSDAAETDEPSARRWNALINSKTLRGRVFPKIFTERERERKREREAKQEELFLSYVLRSAVVSRTMNRWSDPPAVPSIASLASPPCQHLSHMHLSINQSILFPYY